MNERYRREQLENQRIAFASCVRRAIDNVDRRYYRNGNLIGTGRGWNTEIKSWEPRPWTYEERRDYAQDICEGILQMADDGEMTYAGITERENLVLMTVEVNDSPPNTHGQLDIVVGVLGTALELK